MKSVSGTPSPSAPGDSNAIEHRSRGSALEVFIAFLRLGLTSFGGPIAHLGYFRDEFVVRRRWLDEHAYAELLSLCQFLPGPASSQVGFSIGLARAGYLGALAAWIGFTLPSAALLILFAFGLNLFVGAWAAGALHGLQLVAVAIVAQAVWGMARTLCPDLRRATIALVAAGIVLLIDPSFSQIGAILFGGVAGLIACRSITTDHANERSFAVHVSRRVGVGALVVFVLLLTLLPYLSTLGTFRVALFEAFYRSGALVFGGGHVVLPLLRDAIVTPGWVSDATFLSGYGAAQAIPGPLFSFAAYLGAVADTQHALVGAIVGLVGIFLPGFLILLGALPFWESLRRRALARAITAGVNAAVVGLLAAALYHPLWTTSVHTLSDIVLVIAGFSTLILWRAPPVIVVALMVAGGMIT